MTIDVSEAFGIEVFGVALKDDNDDAILYITAGTGTPVGSPAPVNTWYFDQTNIVIYKKIGALDSEWERYGGTDLVSLTGLEYFESLSQENTNTDSWDNKVGFPITSANEYKAGKIKISWSSEYSQNQVGSRVGVRFEWRPVGSSWTTISDVRDSVSKSNQFDNRSGFVIVTLAADANIQIRAQWGRTDDGGTGKFREVRVAIERVGD